MAKAIVYLSRSKLASTLRTLALHWVVAWMYTEPQYVYPVDTCFFCDGTPHIACHVWAANLAVVAVASTIAAAAAAVNPKGMRHTDKLLLCFLVLMRAYLLLSLNTGPSVWICRKWCAVPLQYPQSADGQLRNDQAFCTELQWELKMAVFGMCTNSPTVRGKPRHADTKADLIFKRVFCDYV